MRKMSVFFLLFFLTISCAKTAPQKPLKKNTQDHYYIKGLIENYNNFKVFLYRETNGLYKKSDSFLIKQNTFWFRGKAAIPERALIAFEKKLGNIPLILANDSISLEISIKNLQNTQIKGSKLNNAFNKIMRQSAEIYSEIDYLYPQFQKARLENNSNVLKEISEKIKAIEHKNDAFLLQYAANNTTSNLAAIILNDVLEKDSLNNAKAAKIFNQFSNKVKQSKAAKAIAIKLAK